MTTTELARLIQDAEATDPQTVAMITAKDRLTDDNIKTLEDIAAGGTPSRGEIRLLEAALFPAKRHALGGWR